MEYTRTNIDDFLSGFMNGAGSAVESRNVIKFKTADYETDLTIFDREGNRWVPSAQVGEALGSTRIRALVSELTDSGELREGKHWCTLTVHLPGDTQPRKYLVLSYRGIIRVAMRSEGKRAKEFRDWAEEVLYEVMMTGRYDIDINPGNAFFKSGLLRKFKHRGLKTSQRLRLLELSSRIAQMDAAGIENMMGAYDFLCGELVSQAEDGCKVAGLPESIRRFFETRLVFDYEAVTTKDDLYEDYEFCCKEWRSPVVSREQFFKHLYAQTDTTASRRRMNGEKTWAVRGVSLQ